MKNNLKSTLIFVFTLQFNFQFFLPKNIKNYYLDIVLIKKISFTK